MYSSHIVWPQFWGWHFKRSSRVSHEITQKLCNRSQPFQISYTYCICLVSTWWCQFGTMKHRLRLWTVGGGGSLVDGRLVGWQLASSAVLTEYLGNSKLKHGSSDVRAGDSSQKVPRSIPARIQWNFASKYTAYLLHLFVQRSVWLFLRLKYVKRFIKLKWKVSC